MKFKIKLPYNQPKEITDEDGQKIKNPISEQELTLDYISHAIGQTFKDGLTGSQRRTYGRFQRKMDEAIEQKAEAIELADDEKDLIKKAFNEVSFPASLSKFVIVLEDEIDNLK